MILSAEVPDSIARQLQLDGPESGRRALEMFTLEGYRDGNLSRGQIGEMLGMSFDETEALLRDHHASSEFTLEEIKEDEATCGGFWRDDRGGFR